MTHNTDKVFELQGRDSFNSDNKLIFEIDNFVRLETRGKNSRLTVDTGMYFNKHS